MPSPGTMACQNRGFKTRGVMNSHIRQLKAFEVAQHELAADTGFVEFIDEVTGAYVVDANITRSTLYMRIN